MEILLLLFVIAVGFTVFGLVIYHGTRRGEDCHAAECIIEIGRKKDDA